MEDKGGRADEDGGVSPLHGKELPPRKTLKIRATSADQRMRASLDEDI
jgi:hypothetical protein